jgi:MFS family permease
MRETSARLAKLESGMAGLPRSVKTLGVVSLLTDASSEMIYPLLPSFVTKTLGAGPAFLGLVEGTAEAAASLLKIASGWLSDRAPRRKPFVVAGYALSTAARPLVAAATAPWHVFAVRIADRIGKGTRTAPRDALLAAVTPRSQRGRAFGFHRAMDHAGAVVGPLLASLLLLVTDDLRLVFAAALVPGILAMAALVFGVREEHAAAATRSPVPALPPDATAPSGAASSAHGFTAYLAVLAVFTLGNSSDVFLLLCAQEAGVSLALVPIVWTVHHAVKALASTYGGALSDRIGRRNAILAGWAVYAASYAGFAVAATPVHVFLLFAFYGLFHALTEGPERALVADLADVDARGRAFGLYHAVTGTMLLPASVLTGALWQTWGATAALSAGAALSAIAAIGLCLLVPEPPRGPSDESGEAA